MALTRERGNTFLRRLDFYAGIPLAYATGMLRRVRLPKKFPAHFNPQSICILCFGAIGDLLLASGLVDGLRKRFPDARIDILSSKANEAALPLIRGVDGSASFAITNVAAMIGHARAARYDLLFDTSQWSRVGAIVSNLSGAALTVGFNTAGQHRSWGYDIVALHRGDWHELNNFLALGKAVWGDFEGQPCLCPPLVDEAAQTVLQKTVFCHMWPAPGRGSIFKTWPEEYWAALAATLAEKDLRVCFTGAPGEAGRTEEFIKKFCAGKGNICSVAGRYSLQDLGGSFCHARAVISVNTGIMHLAALLGAPTVGLHGATNPRRWGPYGPRTVSLLPHAGRNAYLDLGFEYPPDAKPNMHSLPVEDVLKALSLLGAMA